MSWPQIKNSSFWSVIFSYSIQQQWTISWSDCDMWWKVDFRWQSVTTVSTIGLKRSFKTLSKAKLAPKKVMVTGGLLPIWSATAFCIPAKPLHLRSVLSKLMRCTEKNGYTCSRHLILLHDNAWPCCTTNSSKVEWIGLRSFTSSATFTWPLANWLPLLQASRQLFAGKTLPQPAGGRKYFSRVCRIPKHGFLHYRNKPAYFSLAKMCWL